MNPLEHRLRRHLSQRSADGSLRTLAQAGAGIDFFSNDYLGIATNGLPFEFLADNHMQCPTGSTGARLISGNSEAFAALEATVAAHHGAEAALVYNSGYDANTGLITALGGRHTVFLYDELCHASIIDGIRAATCRRSVKFRHNDEGHLSELLEAAGSGQELVVVTESVFSMDGDTAPLAAIAGLCATYQASLIVDEAHATGVYGKHGEGLVHQLELRDQVFATVHTFGKALGCFGAAVAGSRTLINFLVNFSRPFIYTTALPPSCIQAVLAVYRYMNSGIFDNSRLHAAIHAFRAAIAPHAGWADSTSPIQALQIPGNEACIRAAQIFRNNKINVKAILSPTVPKGKERIRLCVHAFNTAEEIKAVAAICKLLSFAQQ